MLEEQANRNLVTFSEDKCKALLLGRKPRCSSPGWGMALGALCAAEHRPAVCPGSKDDQQPPGMC